MLTCCQEECRFLRERVDITHRHFSFRRNPGCWVVDSRLRGNDGGAGSEQQVD